MVIHVEIHKVNWRVKLRLKDVKEETISANSTNTQIQLKYTQRAKKRNGIKSPWWCDATTYHSFVGWLVGWICVFFADINHQKRYQQPILRTSDVCSIRLGWFNWRTNSITIRIISIEIGVSDTRLMAFSLSQCTQKKVHFIYTMLIVVPFNSYICYYC